MIKSPFLRRAAMMIFVFSFLAACEAVESPDLNAGDIKVSTDVTGLSPEAARIKGHIAFLADDALEGREAGTAGYDLAAKYVSAQFKALDLKPGGDNGSWLQDVPLRELRRDLDKAEMTLTRNGETITLTHLEDYLAGPSSRRQEASISGEAVFVSYGLIAPEFGINDYEGLDAKGKIVVVLGGTPSGIFPSEEGAHYGNSKIRTAANQGAIGYVTIYSANLKKRFPWQRVIGRADGVGVTWIQKDGETFSTTPEIAASAFMNPEATEKLFEGAPKSYADILAETEEKGSQSKGFNLPGTISLKSGTKFNDLTSHNVAAVLEGSDPDLKDEYVVLSAHLDHIGIRKNAEPGTDNINNGAMDNASGIATMLEVAHTMSLETREGKGPRRSVIFLAVTAEEKGLIGSQYFAYNPTVQADALVANVNLDMALLLYPFSDLIAFGADHSSLGPIVAAAAAEMGVEVVEDPIPEQSIFTRSDHYRFVQQGIPSVFLWPGFGNGGEKAVNDFLSTHYHRPSDDLNLPIDYEQGARFAKLNHLVATAIANGDERPTWNEGDFFGELYGTK